MRLKDNSETSFQRFSEDKTIHWANQYRNALGGTLESFIYSVACYTARYSEQEVREIAKIAFDWKTNVFHACWQYSKRDYPCPCAPCAKQRNGAK